MMISEVWVCGCDVVMMTNEVWVCECEVMMMTSDVWVGGCQPMMGTIVKCGLVKCGCVYRYQVVLETIVKCA